MLSVYKERAPEKCQMTAEVSEIAETLNKLNLVSIYTCFIIQYEIPVARHFPSYIAYQRPYSLSVMSAHL